MTDSYERTLAVLLREEREANRILKNKIEALEADRLRLATEVARLDRVILDRERAETERLGTFPAPPRSALGVVAS